jgi:hypothetical protein
MRHFSKPAYSQSFLPHTCHNEFQILLLSQDSETSWAASLHISDLKYSSKIKALELLGKHVGAFDGKANGDGDTEVKVVIDV